MWHDVFYIFYHVKGVKGVKVTLLVRMQIVE